MQLSTEKPRKTEGTITELQAQLRAAQSKIKQLERKIGRSRTIRLDQVELDLLRRIADCDVNSGFAVEFAAGMDLAPARLDYHLQRLVDGGYIELLFTDSALGDSFGISQKGRTALVRKHLL